MTGNCKFPTDTSQAWSCPACVAHRPSTHSSHTHDDKCQWTFASSRTRGSNRDLKDPKPKAHRTPQVAKVDDAVVMPPAPAGLSWTPLTDLELKSILDHCPTDGWHKAFDGAVMLVQSNGRSLRTCEPKLDAQIFKFRSSFGLFSDNKHESGNWWRLEDQIEWTEPEITNRAFGYPVPVLIQLCEKKKGVRPQKIIPDAANEKRKPISSGLPLSADPLNPLNRLIKAWDDEADGLPPDVVPPTTAEQTPEQLDIVPEWSSYDLGASLRALKSDSEPQQNRALRRLHLRWFHASATRMASL